MGKFKAKRKAKKAEREKTAVAKVQAKGTKKRARVTKRTNASLNRTNKRAAGSAARVNKRKVATLGRVSKRAEKKYGELPPDSIDAVEDVAPMTEDLAGMLEEDGIELEDPTDPIEVATRFVQESDEMESQLDDETYDDAFINKADHYDGIEGYENFDWKAAAKRGAAGAFGGVVNEITKYTAELKDKAAAGRKLSPEEQRLLDARMKAEGKIKGAILDEIKPYLPWVVLAILLFIFRKKLFA